MESDMNKEQLIEKVNGILAEEFETDVAEMQPDASLMEVLDLDSVDMVVLVEKHFGIIMKKEDFGTVRTFADFYDYLESRLK